MVLLALGRPAEAEAALRRGVALDTLDNGVALVASQGLYLLGRADEVVALARRHPFHGWPLRALLVTGRCPDPTSRFTTRVYAALCSGDSVLARHQADSVVAASGRTGEYWPPWTFASWYAFLGDRERALLYLERAVEERDAGCATIALDPAWRALRSDPRFAELVRRVGVSPPGDR